MVIYLLLFTLFSFKTMFKKCFGWKQHLQQLILSIGCCLEFWGSKVQWKFYPIFLPTYSPSTRLVPKIFGCASFVHVHAYARGKLDPRAIKCVFIGYSSTQKGYKCYHPPTREIFVTVDVTFFENESYFHPFLWGGGGGG